MEKVPSKKYYAFLLLGVLTLLLSTIVYAEAVETATASTTSEQIKIQPEQSSSTNEVSTTSTTTNITEVPVLIPVASDPVSKNSYLSPAKQNRITNLCANISNRLDAVIMRQDNIAKRLQSRLAKLETENIDTAQAKEKLTITLANVDKTKKTMLDIDSRVYKMVMSPNPIFEWEMVKKNYLQADNLVKQNHTELQSIIYIIKNNNLKIEEVSTTTTSSN